ncbi:MAG: nucleotidyltransferase domain-containing protein [Anaerolineales bacterium]|nr:nucleotidyltransferase domain-containing protein [Chloroflexota bacterium]MBL6980682.1 nucleotidyltransferase domain-containing protein [Anaerolineales bacterium]
MKTETPLKQDTRLQTKQVTPALLSYIVEKIVREIGPKQIILFGSRAKGDANELSDVDLFIVHESEKSNREVRREIEYLLWGRRFGIDLIVRNSDDVAQNIADSNPFYSQHIFAEGHVLYEQHAS